MLTDREESTPFSEILQKLRLDSVKLENTCFAAEI